MNLTCIFKYPVDRERTFFYAPAHGKPLCIKLQNDMPTLWMLHEGQFPQTEYKMLCLPTGAGLPNLDGYTYCGTLLLINDKLVLHYFLYEKPITHGDANEIPDRV